MRPELFLQQQAADQMLQQLQAQAGGGPIQPVMGLPGIYSDYYPPEFWKYNTQYAGKLEWIGWRWWDTKSYVSGTTTSLTNFFGTIPATVDVGNMQVAAQLAAPNAFMVRAVGWYLKQRPRSIARAASTNPNTGAVDNVAQLANTGVAQLTIGTKVYGQWTLHQLTSGGGAWGLLALEGATADPGGAIDYGQPGVPDPRAIYALSKPLFIAPQINFKIDITWPAALTLTGNTDIEFFLDGDIIRPVQ